MWTAEKISIRNEWPLFTTCGTTQLGFKRSISLSRLRAEVMAMQIKRTRKIQTGCSCVGVLPTFRVEFNTTNTAMAAVAAVVRSVPVAQLVRASYYKQCWRLPSGVVKLCKGRGFDPRREQSLLCNKHPLYEPSCQMWLTSLSCKVLISKYF